MESGRTHSTHDAEERTRRQQEADYSRLQKLVFDLVASQAGHSIADGQAWLNDAQALAQKLYEHLTSLRALTIAHRVEIDEQRYLEFVDHSSGKVLPRAAFETYLVFFFIFGGSDRSRCQFRHKIWKFGGLADREKTVITSTLLREKQVVEKAAADHLRSEIKAPPHFAAYGPDAKKRILKGEWRGGASWEALSRSAQQKRWIPRKLFPEHLRLSMRLFTRQLHQRLAGRPSSVAC